MKAMNGTTVLFVEDDPVVLTAYGNRLRQEGFQVEPAHDGLEALKLLSVLAPDVVILDLVLPKFNGEDVLKFIHKQPRLHQIPVIILSTTSADISAEPILERAQRQFLKETCNFPMLLRAIQEVLSGTPPPPEEEDLFFLMRLPDGKLVRFDPAAF